MKLLIRRKISPILLITGLSISLVMSGCQSSATTTGSTVSEDQPSEADSASESEQTVEEIPALPGFPTPTQSPPTPRPAVPTPDGEGVRASDIDVPTPQFAPDLEGDLLEGWNPPSFDIPIARHPYDHFWMSRPVGSNNTNSGLSYYPFASNGPANDLRIHHGIDIANPIGVEVYAAAPGRIVWAGKGHFNAAEGEGITSYGNTVVIEHTFGYGGNSVFTLYAHMSAILAEVGNPVEAGDLIGLIGNTGQVSGPHVHFEVRIGRNSYFAVQNPELWLAPYVGTGVIAGRLELADGELAEDAPIILIDLSTGQVVYRATSYSSYRGVNNDPNWRENFVIPDIPAGRYILTARYNASTWSAQFEVVAGTTNFIELERTDPEIHEEDEDSSGG